MLKIDNLAFKPIELDAIIFVTKMLRTLETTKAFSELLEKALKLEEAAKREKGKCVA